jgi:hypothetical protein
VKASNAKNKLGRVIGKMEDHTELQVVVVRIKLKGGDIPKTRGLGEGSS